MGCHSNSIKGKRTTTSKALFYQEHLDRKTDDAKMESLFRHVTVFPVGSWGASGLFRHCESDKLSELFQSITSVYARQTVRVDYLLAMMVKEP